MRNRDRANEHVNKREKKRVRQRQRQTARKETRVVRKRQGWLGGEMRCKSVSRRMSWRV